MSNYLCGVELPVNLTPKDRFCANMNVYSTSPNTKSTKVMYDDNGVISQINYYSLSGNLIKQQFYQSGKMIAAQYFMENCLYKKEVYENERLSSEELFNSKGNIFKTINYYYNYDKLFAVESLENGISKKAEFETDLIGRITERVIVLNEKRILHQRYRYHKNGNIEAYSDENCTIHSIQWSEEGKLLSYKISDHNGNNISITNNFSRNCYLETEFIVNGKLQYDKNLKYLANVYLLPPQKNIDEVDVILQELNKSQVHQIQQEQMFSTSREHNAITKNTESIVDIPITNKAACPISMRKMVLYSKLLESRKQNINDNILSMICA